MQKENIKILIADDMKMMRVFISRTLKRVGYENLAYAEDGQDAYDKLQDENFSLVICDWNMPRLNGIGLLQKIRSDEKMKDLPFLMVTAEAEQDMVEEAIKKGVNDYILKPVNADVLEKKINDILQEIKK